jgi:transcriptional regulator with XRE-family HTH domain
VKPRGVDPVEGENPTRPPVVGASIGERLGARLEQMGISQKELARRLGMDREQTINDWIKGRQNPRAEHLQLLRVVLQMTIDELLGVADGQDPPFEAWSVFRGELERNGDHLERDEERALKSILWPEGKEPTVFGYQSQLALLRGGGVRPRKLS